MTFFASVFITKAALQEPTSSICGSEAIPMIEEGSVREHLRKWDEKRCIEEY